MNPLERLWRHLGRRNSFAIFVLLALGCMTAAGCEREAEPVFASARSSEPAPGAYVLDPEHSFIYFSAQHMVVGRVRGRFNTMTGTALAATDPQSSRVDVVIDAASVDTQSAPRDVELRGPAFFNVKAFPTVEYHGGNFRRLGDKWIVDGALTISGVTREVPLELVFKGTAPRQEGTPNRIAVRAVAAVKRADFGMTRGLLNEIGTVSANPDVWIEIDAEFLARAQPSPSGEPGIPSKSRERR